MRGESPLEAGLWLLPATGGMVVGAIIAPAVVRRVPAFFALAAGLVLAELGAAVLTQIEGPSGLGVLTAGSLLIGVGAGSVGTLATDAVVAAAPPERAGAASAISETGAEIGGALGIAVLGSIGAAVYRNAIAIPQGVPPEDAAVARDTLGGAVETGKDLPASTEADLLDAASAAFLDGLQVAAGFTAALVAATAVVAAILLRRLPFASEPEAEPEAA